MQIQQIHDPKVMHLDGIKFQSVLSLLPYFDLSSGFPVEPMHNMFLGVVDAILTAWVTSSGKPFSIKNKIPRIDLRIRTWHIPREFTRLLRSLRDLAFFKANDFDACLTFYSSNLFDAIFENEEYLDHFHLLAKISFLARQEFISQTDLQTISNWCTEFVERYEILYGVERMTFNVHQILHIPRCIANHGPIFKFSAYPFESMNGRLRSLFNGSNNISSQIMENFLTEKALSSNLPSAECSSASFSRVNSVPIFSQKDFRIFKSGIPVDSLTDAKIKKIFSLPPTTNIFRIKEVFYKSAILKILPQKLTRFLDSFIVSKTKYLGIIQQIYFNMDTEPYVIGKVQTYPLTKRANRAVDASTACAYYVETELSNSGLIEFWDLSVVEYKAGVTYNIAGLPFLIALSPNLLEIR